MAHFSKISEENVVLNVLTLDDKDMLDENNNPSEAVGQAYLAKHNNWPAHLWIQTSYNTYNNIHAKGGNPFRGNYAGIGGIWDPQNQIFINQKPYPSWVLNTEEARWQSPIGDAPALDAEQKKTSYYSWNEDNQSWDLITNEVQDL